MSSPPVPAPATLPTAVTRRSLAAAYVDLTKARLVSLVVLTAAVGFVMASGPAIAWLGLLWTALGTALAAGGANALNQCLERDRDAIMLRTWHRPIPAGDILLRDAVLVGVGLSLAGPILLLLTTNALSAGLAAANVLLYVLVYTPLKIRTHVNTLVGAVCGAIPPMLGWAAATGRLEYGAWLLGAVLFVWQIPHFLALAWMYRADYTSAGYQMLSRLDEDGQLTSRIMLISSLLLIPVGLMPAPSLAGLAYAVGALALGTYISLAALRLWMDRSRDNARRVFLASLVYLPLLLGLMVLDRQPNW